MKILFITLLAGLSACSWVELDEKAKLVRIITAEQLLGCKKVGNVTAKTRAEILGAQRNSDKITIELERLAKNEAVKLGADTLVAKHTPNNGEQAFHAYQCHR